VSMKGKGTPWSAEEEARLREVYPFAMTRDIAPQFGRSAHAVKSRALVLRLMKAKQRKEWTAADAWMLRAFYPHLRNDILARRLGCTVFALYRRAHQLGLHKSQIFLDGPDSGRTRPGDTRGAARRFQKGHVSQNKGLRRPGYFRGRMRETQFRKGQRPHNEMPLWSFRFNSMGYLMLKTGKPAPKPNDGWEWVHKLVWEQAHGPVPADCRIWWKDRDHGNCALSNLELVSDAEHMKRTTIHNFPELRAAIFSRRVYRPNVETLRRHMRKFQHKTYGQPLSAADLEFLALPRRAKCSEKACPFPHADGSAKCRYHEHFFEFKWSMEWRALDRGDVYGTGDIPIPLFTSMPGWEIPYSHERTVFEHNGERDRGRKLSDTWWREQVIKAEEAPAPNSQHTGAFVLFKGFGKRKIRKVQRKRAQQAGWHGHHPEQKPRDSFSRDTLEDLPRPQDAEDQQDQQNEDVYLDAGFTPLYP